jgi:hypothetical protein
MSEIKLNPLLIFLILLIVLVVATTVKRWGLVSEGFNSYLKGQDSFSSQTVGAYNSKVAITKLYDDIFFDQRNGNAVIVTGSQYSDTADSTGSTITGIDIIPRSLDNVYTYEKDASTKTMIQQSPESMQTTVDSIDTAWTVASKYNQLTYITWGNDTYLYVMDLTNATVAGNTVTGNTVTGNTTTGNTVATTGSFKHAVMGYYNGSIKQTHKDYTKEKHADIQLLPSYSYNKDSKDDTNIVETFYDKTKTVFQLLTNVMFDFTNGNLLILNGQGTTRTINVYYRNSANLNKVNPDVKYTAPTNTNTPASKRRFSQTTSQPYFIQDTLGGHTIMYWPSGDNTILAVFANTLNKETDSIRVVKCRRFTKNGLYNSSDDSANEIIDSSDNTIDEKSNDALLDAFSRWYIYFNTNAVGSNNSSDYLLKTQIVPPVCPACPGCQSQGVCTDCGGNGGSGTKASNKDSLAFGATGATGTTAVKPPMKGPIGVAGNIVNSSVDTAGNVVEKTLDTAGNVVGKTLDTAENVVGKTFDVAGNVVGKTFDAAGNLLSSTADRLGLDRVGYKQSYNGPSNTSSSAGASGYPSSGYNNTQYRPGSNTTGVSTLPNSSPKDPYSYNGALQSKGGNYVSMTTDFSRFGR